MREIVRNFKAERTHLADVEQSVITMAFGATYRTPDPSTVALCGVKITDGVIMQTGTSVRCPTCRFADKKGL